MSRPLYTRWTVALNGLVLAGGLIAVTGTAGTAQAAAAPPPRQLHVVSAMTRPTAVVKGPARAAGTAVRKPAVRRTAPRTRATTGTHPRSARPATRTRTAAAPRPRAAVLRSSGSSASSWSAAFSAAIARIPGYSPGAARWVVSDAYGHWGTADWYHGVVYVSPSVPQSKLYDVVVHEWSHLLSVAAYDGDVHVATAAMNSYFGGSGLTGAERAADCMALALGARWTHYTSCQNSSWRAGAARLVRKEQL